LARSPRQKLRSMNHSRDLTPKGTSQQTYVVSVCLCILVFVPTLVFAGSSPKAKAYIAHNDQGATYTGEHSVLICTYLDITGKTPNSKKFVAEEFENSKCPEGKTLLRQNVKTGEIVRIENCGVGECYLDECIKPGLYRYGFAEPYACPEGKDIPDWYKILYYTEVEVTSTSSCERSKDKPAPTPYAGTVPWQDDPIKCSGGGPFGCSTLTSQPAPLTWVGLFLLLSVLRRKRLLNSQ